MAKEKKAKATKKKDTHGKKDKQSKKKQRKEADVAESQRVTPYLLYNDVAGALDWLARAFGFAEYGERFEGPDGRVQHAAMRTSKKGEILMMGCPGAEYRNPKALGASTQSLYIQVDDVDGHFARAEKAGVHVLEPPTDAFYGDRRYRVEDPEGHQWAFAQHVRDVSVEEMKAAMKG